VPGRFASITKPLLARRDLVLIPSKEEKIKKTSSLIITIIFLVLCGIPGIISCLGGMFIAVFGLSADKAQLKLDTNLDQGPVILTGVGGICLGLILAAIPILIWLWATRHKSVEETKEPQ